MKRYLKILPLCIALLSMISCSDEGTADDWMTNTATWEIVKVAVVAPQSGDDSDNMRFKRISRYFEENATRAQYLWEDGLRLELEWYDEEHTDLTALAEEFRIRKDLKAVIGPMNDDNVEKMAQVLQGHSLPMLVMSPSEELLRKYTCSAAGTQLREPFLWSLCESDITQAQLLLHKISSSGASKVSLVSGENVYGNTYYRWIPYHAIESNLELVDNLQYNNLSELQSNMDKLLASDTEYIICALNDIQEVKLVLEASRQNPNAPKLYFTGSVFKGDLLSLGELTEGMEGFSLYSSPNTGFHLAYQERFGEYPKPYESQFYDALLLSFVAANICHYGNMGMDMNEALMTLSDLPLTEDNDMPEFYDWGKGIPVWDYFYLMNSVLSPIRTERLPELNLLGASGNLKFAKETYTSLVQSTYINWMIYNGQPVVLDFIAAQGNRVSNYQEAWMWQSTISEDFSDADSTFIYPELEEKWAVLICGSKGWDNYRHQADLLNFYHFLKSKGMKDDRIILIMQDDIANNKKNPYPGIIRSWPNGKNLYDNFELDYMADTLSVDDITDILLGKKNHRLSVVLESTSHDNVLFYWTGHGATGSFSWLDKERFTHNQLKQIMTQLHAEKHYRQLLMLAEPCCSSSVVKAVEGFDGILGIASADEAEYSFADHYNSELRAWMCDRFTNNLVTELGNSRYISFYDLYKKLNTSTIGSHVRIFNHKKFGNLYNMTPRDFY